MLHSSYMLDVVRILSESRCRASFLSPEILRVGSGAESRAHSLELYDHVYTVR